MAGVISDKYMNTSGGKERNKPFPSCFEPHYESEAKCKVFVLLKISFHSYANKTNFHMKSFALILLFEKGVRPL